jgi:hypothetical protein
LGHPQIADAQDAIDNMDMNELNGRVLKVNLARPMKGALQPNGNRASAYLRFSFPFALYPMAQCFLFAMLVWESEEWLKEHVKPLAQSGGLFIFILIYLFSSSLHSGVQGRLAQTEGGDGGDAVENKSDDEPMEE